MKRQPLCTPRSLMAFVIGLKTQWRFMTWNHHRFVEAVRPADRAYIECALENSRFKNNTLIIFAADHGESKVDAIEHFRNSVYTRKASASRLSSLTFNDQLDVPKNVLDTKHFVSGVDLVPTVLDYAGIDVPDGVQGLSLKPLVELAHRNVTRLKSTQVKRMQRQPRKKFRGVNLSTSNPTTGHEQ